MAYWFLGDTNMAYNKEAFQSSTLVRADGYTAGASRAVNNKYGYDAAETLQNEANWWRIDLGRAMDISLIELYNHPGYCYPIYCSEFITVCL